MFRLAVQLHVFAIGQGFLRYQWYLNQDPVPGAIGPNLFLSQVQPSQSGDYTVKITDDFTSTTSSPAQLTVLVPPLIVGQPQDQTVRTGDTATFRVTASGNAPLSYFWMHNGQLLRDQKNPVLILPNVQEADIGTYAVFVRHLTPDGPVTSQSASALLTVVP